MNDISAIFLQVQGSSGAEYQIKDAASRQKVEDLSSKLNRIWIEDRISGIEGYSDLSVVKLSANEFNQIVIDDELLSNCIYVVQDDYVDVYGHQVKNLCDGTDVSDAVNLGQLSSVRDEIPLSVSQLQNDEGFLKSGNLLSTLGSIPKSKFLEIPDPKASVNSVQQILLSVLTILRETAS